MQSDINLLYIYIYHHRIKFNQVKFTRCTEGASDLASIGNNNNQSQTTSKTVAGISSKLARQSIEVQLSTEARRVPEICEEGSDTVFTLVPWVKT